jgi:hypothetical protein
MSTRTLRNDNTQAALSESGPLGLPWRHLYNSPGTAIAGSFQKLGRPRWRLPAGFLVAVGVSSLGCGQGANSSGEEGQVRAAMVLLGREYGTYVGEHNGAPPKDETALRAYLESRLGELSAFGVNSVDDLLRAGRDGQPIQMIYGEKVVSPDRPEYPWAAYEQVGVDGKRLASDARGGIYEIGDEEFSRQIPIK